ncbi:hypothetical protein BZG01_00200 [Labilibaculum manganireducens]|uniref:Uncharacterized protein n=1 Tax=Labilibaculum manganireducens TaxID=1940525 RepID=A0A2N3IGD7_9BACT|nr:hypothetical protein [Labilibaculum manganireducens]PKQ69394.1 hypothetical protein BZG01_00200 [Labilibaculum manganireducens]
MAKKAFKQTKVGQWLTKKAPGIIDTIGDVFPPAKLLSNLIGSEPSLSNEDKLEFEKLLTNTYLKELEYHERNTNGARDMYASSKEMTDWLAKRIMNWNLPMLVLLIGINIVCLNYFESIALALISNIIGHVMQLLINERITVANFFLGSSKGSKDKTQEMLFKNENHL